MSRISQALPAIIQTITIVAVLITSLFNLIGAWCKLKADKASKTDAQATSTQEYASTRRGCWSMTADVFNSFSLLVSSLLFAYLGFGPLAGAPLTVGIASMMCLALGNVVMAVSWLKR